MLLIPRTTLSGKRALKHFTSRILLRPQTVGTSTLSTSGHMCLCVHPSCIPLDMMFDCLEPVMP